MIVDMNIFVHMSDDDTAVEVKRGPGRPRGTTKTKPTEPKRPVGRPRGSGPKQIAAASQARIVDAKRAAWRARQAYSMQNDGDGPESLSQVCFCCFYRAMRTFSLFSRCTQPVPEREPPRPALTAAAREASADAWRTLFSAGPSRSTLAARQTRDRATRPTTVTTPVVQQLPTSIDTTTQPTATHTSEIEVSGSTMVVPPVAIITPDPQQPLATTDTTMQPPPSNLPSSTQCTWQVIADEDPERSVACANDDEEDGYFGLMGDGLGEDDQCDDEDYDGPDPSLGKARERRLPPPWLKLAFDQKVNESARSHRGPDGLPPLYRDHRTFWFPRPSTFFLLRSSVSPQDLYNPRFFLWDPAALCAEGIPCPNCRVALKPHGHISSPRRCVDVDGPFWMIGYRYRCFNCVHSASGKNTITFRSWDPRILLIIPQSLASEFPARLSHRSALSLSALNLMCVCLQNGMGAKQFSDALRVQHIEHYDRLHVQYLNWLTERRGLSSWIGLWYKPFLPYDDRTPDGFGGFVPSAQWLRDIYDDFIEEHRAEFEQHTAMLSADICAIDHSHKVRPTMLTQYPN